MGYYTTLGLSGKEVVLETEQRAEELAQRSANALQRTVPVFYHWTNARDEERTELVKQTAPERKRTKRKAVREIEARMRELVVEGGMSVEDAAAQVTKERAG